MPGCPLRQQGSLKHEFQAAGFHPAAHSCNVCEMEDSSKDAGPRPWTTSLLAAVGCFALAVILYRFALTTMPQQPIPEWLRGSASWGSLTLVIIGGTILGNLASFPSREARPRRAGRGRLLGIGGGLLALGFAVSAGMALFGDSAVEWVPFMASASTAIQVLGSVLIASGLSRPSGA